MRLVEPAVGADTERAGSPFEKRVRVVEGDLLKDLIPNGHDLVLLSGVNHLLSPEHNVELFRRIREQVASGARLLLADTWTDATHTQPLVPVLMAGTFLITSGEGDVYSEDEAKECYKRPVGGSWET